MDRRRFMVSATGAALASVLPTVPGAFAEVPGAHGPTDSFEWTADQLRFRFHTTQGRLRQLRLLPTTFPVSGVSSGAVEAAVQCDGENSPDAGMKLGVGQPGLRLSYVGKQHETLAAGERLILRHLDESTHLQVESFYQSFNGCAVVRRWTRLTNLGKTPLGISYVSSAMLHGLAPAQDFEDQLRIHLAVNSWMAEGQWHRFKPSELGFVDNERTSWSEASASSIGSWSAGKFLPMAVVENTRDGLAWFWQIEHNGSWYWEISNTSEHGNVAEDVYAYLGGPDDLHADAWKQLGPGQTYETVPVALGCVQGGFTDAVRELTVYRRKSLHEAARRSTTRSAVIFNDYMNCLWGDPTEAKELPMIEAAAKAGCEYYVIDAGWYAGLHEDWSPTLGGWQPSSDRWPNGLEFTMNKIKQAGMIPGLWLEPEVAGRRSELARTKPESWFFQRHGARVLRNSRYMLDFRNPDVTTYLSDVVRRLVTRYGVGYIKMDYNVNTLTGTDLRADSPGQGLLEHNRALQQWLDHTLQEFSDLVIENCGSGGGRMDYAMLSRLGIQSMTDQEDHRRLPAILSGVSAAVLPEQIGVWSYPLAESDGDQASFNMVTAMTARIHQSGRLDKLSQAASTQVRNAIAIYKDEIRQHLTSAVPLYPLGLPDVNEKHKPIALAMRSATRTFLSVWRLEGDAACEIPLTAKRVDLLFPSGLGITAERAQDVIRIHFPRPYMACVLSLT